MEQSIKDQNKNIFKQTVLESIKEQGIEEVYRYLFFYLIDDSNVNFTKEALFVEPNFKNLVSSTELTNGKTALEFAATNSPQIYKLLM